MDFVRLRQNENKRLTQNGIKKLTLTWKDINVKRDRIISNNFWRHKVESVNILNDVSGIAYSGKLMAIMGPSGAGKTSLLATISSRNSFSAGGSLKLDGIPVTAAFMAANSGFAPQHDLVFANLTVLEHLTFMAVMKMDHTKPEHYRRQRINQLLMDFGVSECSKSQLKSVSGGEMKRLTLCVELLNDPPILFCDEPTTGLDSWVASSVVGMLRNLALSGKMVICSIHQPASGIFEMFHDVLLLADGRTAFHGSTADTAQFLNELDFHCPENFNKAEYYISLLSVPNDLKLNTNNKAMIICEAFYKSNYCYDMKLNIENNQNANITHANHYKDLSKSENMNLSRFGKMKLRQFRWLLWRLLLLQKRCNVIKYEFAILLIGLTETDGDNYKMFRLFLLISSLVKSGVALMITIPVINVTSQLNQQNIQNLEGLLYMTVTDVVFTQIFSVVNVFPSEKPIILREISCGLYSSGPYYASKVVNVILPSSINAFCFGTIVYWLANLRGGFVGYISFLLVLVLAANAATAFGLLLCASFKTIHTAFLVNVPFQQLAIMYSGFFINLQSIPVYLQWLKYTSLFYYGVENLSILQWTLVDNIQCSDDQQPCIHNGYGVLSKYGYIVDNFYVNILGLLIVYIVCHLLGYIMVNQRSRKQAVY